MMNEKSFAYQTSADMHSNANFQEERQAVQKAERFDDGKRLKMYAESVNCRFRRAKEINGY